jgi:hypothetical protein
MKWSGTPGPGARRDGGGQEAACAAGSAAAHPEETSGAGSANAAPPAAPSGSTYALEEVEAIKARLAVLCARRKKKPTKAERAVIARTRRELKAAVNTPVSGGRDPFDWLPDELLVMVLLMLPVATMWSGACERVCQRWARLMGSSPIKRRKHEERWAAYELGVIKPQELKGHRYDVAALAVGIDGKVYTGAQSGDSTIKVWSGEDGVFLQTLEGHSKDVCSLAVGLDGKIYSGSLDHTIRVWSGDCGVHLQTLEGHAGTVRALAVGHGNVYSGSADMTIKQWSGDDGTLLHTLEGHTDSVHALAVGLDGNVYSTSNDFTLRVWSGVDGTNIHTLHRDGYTTALTVGLDGMVYSAHISFDGAGYNRIIEALSTGEDGVHPTRLLESRMASARALAVGQDGKIFVGS